MLWLVDVAADACISLAVGVWLNGVPSELAAATRLAASTDALFAKASAASWATITKSRVTVDVNVRLWLRLLLDVTCVVHKMHLL